MSIDNDYWRERWQKGETGFHKTQVNPLLLAHEQRLTSGRPCRVFVPLCGKSVDMGYLAGRGHQVLGVDLSAKAADAFFEEHGLRASRSRDRPSRLERYEAAGVTILAGDLFDLSKPEAGQLDAAYDRAALVALPPAMRHAYVDQITALLSPGAPILLLAFDYDDTRMQGPPFRLTGADVHALFDRRGSVELLEERDGLPDNPRFAERGALWATESAYLITPARVGTLRKALTHGGRGPVGLVAEQALARASHRSRSDPHAPSLRRGHR